MLKTPRVIKRLFTVLRSSKRKFNTSFDSSRFVRESNVKRRVFENMPPAQQFLLDLYWQQNEEPKFSTNPLKTCLLDIETYSPDSFS